MNAPPLAIAVLVLGLLTPAWSAPASTVPMPDKGNTLIVPAASPLHLHGFNKDGWAQFDGSLVISGTYYYGNDLYGEGEGGAATLTIFPDRATRSLLPRFRRPVTDVGWVIENADAFAAAVVPGDKLAILRKGGTLVVTGKIGIRVDHVTAWTACGNANFTARFVAVTSPPRKFAAPALDAPDC
ncbi:MAG TPA: hypothetical protein VMU08_06050 [Rhizomicrobium sp.]|nr:hypothetical protein [Rhizomicrobium sp.]